MPHITKFICQFLDFQNMKSSFKNSYICFSSNSGCSSNWLNCGIYCNIMYSLRLGLNVSWLQCDISHLRVPPLLIIKSKHASILLFKTFYLPLLPGYEKPQEVIIKPNEDLPFRNFVLCSGKEKNWFVTSKPRDVLKKM